MEQYLTKLIQHFIQREAKQKKIPKQATINKLTTAIDKKLMKQKYKQKTKEKKNKYFK